MYGISSNTLAVSSQSSSSPPGREAGPGLGEQSTEPLPGSASEGVHRPPNVPTAVEGALAAAAAAAPRKTAAELQLWMDDCCDFGGARGCIGKGAQAPV